MSRKRRTRATGAGHLGATLAVAALVAGATPGSRSSPGLGSGEKPVPESERVPYGTVQGVFDAKCVRCHTGPEAARGLQLDSWERLIAGSSAGEAVIPFDPDHSLLIGLATRRLGGPHPTELGAEPLSGEEIELLAAWVREGARSAAGQVPFEDARSLLYVADQGSAMISVIDMRTNVVIRTVDLQELGFGPDAFPHHIAVEPDGSFWYVSLIAANAVLKFNRANELVGRVAFERPGLLALAPDSDRLYVGRSMVAANPPHRIGVIRRSDLALEEVDVFLPRPHALAVSPDGRYVIASSLAVNQIAVVDPEEEEVELTELGGERPHVVIQFAISPDGREMVGTTEVTSRLFFFDLDRTPDLTPVDTLELPAAPWHPVYTPDGRWVYVGNNWDNSVAVVDARERRIANVIRGNGLAQPHGSAVSPDGRYVYVSSRNLEMPPGHTKASHVYRPRYDLGDNAHVGTVVVIDTRTQEIVKVLEVGEYASGLGTAAVRR
ncbi:MAG: beta-propeller fold lactonase family protein [Gemmatimonadota bacterium]